jgi:hypothetical protein
MDIASFVLQQQREVGSTRRNDRALPQTVLKWRGRIAFLREFPLIGVARRAA